MNKLLAHVNGLAVHIGPRGTTTSQEKQAGDYIAKAFQSLGYATVRQSFPTVTSFSWVQIFYFSGFIMSIIISQYAPHMAWLVSLVLFALYLLDIETYFSLSTFLPKGNSENIIARQDQNRPKTLVITAHYDSSRSSLNFHPKLVKNFRTSFVTLFCSLVAITFLNVLTAFPLEVRWYPLFTAGKFLGGLVVLSVLLTLVHREIWGAYTPGANDNASGVAVMLGVAEKIRDTTLHNFNIEFVATGAEEAGTFGILAYLKTYGLKDRLFINLDNLGAGDLFVTSEEGIIFKHKASPTLIEAATTTAKEQGLPISVSPYRLLTTDATPIMARQGQAISLMAKDQEGLLPNWHWETDTADNVNVENLAMATELVVKMISQLDRVGG